ARVLCMFVSALSPRRDLVGQPSRHAAATRPGIAGFGIAIFHRRGAFAAHALAGTLADGPPATRFQFRELATQRVDLHLLRAVVGLIEGAKECALLIEVHLRKPLRYLFSGKLTVGPCHRSYS